MARNGRTRRGTVEVSGDEKVLHSAVNALATASANIGEATKLIVKSGHADAERVKAALTRVDRRLLGLSRQVNPDAVKEREKARKLRRISALEKKVADLKAALKE